MISVGAKTPSGAGAGLLCSRSQPTARCTAVSATREATQSARIVTVEKPRAWEEMLGRAFRARQKRTEKEMKRLQRKLYEPLKADPEDLPSTSSGPSPAALAAAPTPSAIMERLLRDARHRQKEEQREDVTRLDVAARCLSSLAIELDADVALVARLAAREGRLLLVPPGELRERVGAVGSAMGLDTEGVLELAARAPRLLCRPLPSLRRSLKGTAALFKARGLPLAEMVAARPDLLEESPASLKAKIDELPFALELSPQRVRDLLVACPSLLRRSTRALQERYQALASLFSGLPRSFVLELLDGAPGLLSFSPATLKAKFAALVARYGAFEDDIVDAVLVDPSVLLNAQPLPEAAGPGAGEPGKQRKGGPAGSQGKGVASASVSAIGSADEAGAGSSGAGRPAPVIKRTSAVDRLMDMAAQAQVPLYDLLALCRADPSLCTTQAQGLRQRAEAVAAALGMGGAEVATVVGRTPALLSLTPGELKQRASALAQLLQQSMAEGAGTSPAPSVSAQAPAGGRSQPRVSLAAVQPVLRRHPELLLQRPKAIKARLAALQELLGLPQSKLAGLLATHPQLVLGNTQQVEARLEALSELLGGLPLRLVGSLVMREPRLMDAPLSAIAARFDTVAASFGAFREDAVDVALADPSTLLPPTALQGSNGGSVGASGGVQPRQGTGGQKGPGKGGKGQKGKGRGAQGSGAADGGGQGLRAGADGMAAAGRRGGAGGGAAAAAGSASAAGMVSGSLADAGGAQSAAAAAARSKKEAEVEAAAALDAMVKAESESAAVNAELRRAQRRERKAAAKSGKGGPGSGQQEEG